MMPPNVIKVVSTLSMFPQDMDIDYEDLNGFK